MKDTTESDVYIQVCAVKSNIPVSEPKWAVRCISRSNINGQ